MYATASPFQAAPGRSLANVYQQVGVQTEADSASPHRLVAMLFGGLMDRLTRSEVAIAAGDTAAKAEHLARALRIVDEGLKAALNVREGGALAQDLSDLYSYVTVRLMHANLHSDAAAIAECKRLIGTVQQAWEAIGPRVDGDK